jgi:hypothetical protein
MPSLRARRAFLVAAGVTVASAVTPGGPCQNTENHIEHEGP